MTVLAGVDVGNTTTEIVLAEVGSGETEIRAAGRAPTAGVKGSAAALAGAARLLESLEAEHGLRAERVALCHQQPVLTFALPLRHRVAADRPLAALATTVATPSDPGLGFGTASRLEETEPGGGPTVVVVARTWDFEDAAARIDELLAAGTEIVAVLVEADEARLIGNRVAAALPIVDEVDPAALAPDEPVAVEVAPPGATVTRLADPLWLASRFGLAEDRLAAVEELTRELADARCAVVSRASARSGAPPTPGVTLRATVDGAERALTLPDDLALLDSVVPGSVRELALTAMDPPPGAGDLGAIRDVFAIVLDELRAGAWLREDLLTFDRQPLAVLAAEVPPEDLRATAERIFHRPASVVASETAAARRGALTTPAAPAGACVCDLGGGTIDLIDADDQASTAAGAGQLLTVALATLLGIPEIVAEAVKRGPALLVESPHLARTETGEKRFLDPPAGAEVLGRLCVWDGGRLRPFSARLGAEEWRTIRLGMKRRLLAANVGRCLRELRAAPPALLLAGGVAEDAEVAAVLSRHLRGSATVVATADVGGRFGPRYAAAVGLALLAAA
jgi:Diol dehydratase reactivase ATPase-like domain/DD-reactivating factor swiveling domain